MIKIPKKFNISGRFNCAGAGMIDLRKINLIDIFNFEGKNIMNEARIPDTSKEAIDLEVIMNHDDWVTNYTPEVDCYSFNFGNVRYMDIPSTLSAAINDDKAEFLNLFLSSRTLFAAKYIDTPVFEFGFDTLLGQAVRSQNWGAAGVLLSFGASPYIKNPVTRSTSVSMIEKMVTMNDVQDVAALRVVMSIIQCRSDTGPAAKNSINNIMIYIGKRK